MIGHMGLLLALAATTGSDSGYGKAALRRARRAILASMDDALNRMRRSRLPTLYDPLSRFSDMRRTVATFYHYGATTEVLLDVDFGDLGWVLFTRNSIGLTTGYSLQNVRA